jgi:hypothetical protein
MGHKQPHAVQQATAIKMDPVTRKAGNRPAPMLALSVLGGGHPYDATGNAVGPDCRII